MAGESYSTYNSAEEAPSNTYGPEQTETEGTGQDTATTDTDSESPYESFPAAESSRVTAESPAEPSESSRAAESGRLLISLLLSRLESEVVLAEAALTAAAASAPLHGLLLCLRHLLMVDSEAAADVT